jgi:uncharacterized membrane protein
MVESRLLKQAWIVAVMAYSLLRTFLIWKIFAKYGVNPYFYLTIDLVCSFFFAVYSTKLVIETNRTHYRRLMRYLVLTFIFNFLPDSYVLLNAKEVPKFIVHSFINIVIILGVVAALSIYREIKKRR